MDSRTPAVFIARTIENGIDRLMPEDRQRASGMAGKRRQEFVSGRLLARHAMQYYGGAHAAAWQLQVQPSGALRITPSSRLSQHPLPAISLSHSRGMAICALAEVTALGADIELQRPRSHLDALATHILHPQEMNAFLQLDTHDKHERFHTIWTLKEALGKALECGTAYPMQEFLIHEGRLLAAPQAWISAPEQWQLWQTTLTGGYHLGLAWRDGKTAGNIAVHTVELET